MKIDIDINAQQYIKNLKNRYQPESVLHIVTTMKNITLRTKKVIIRRNGSKIGDMIIAYESVIISELKPSDTS